MTDLLYKCPNCGHEVRKDRAETAHRWRHPRFDEIQADLAKGVHIRYIREKYNLDRNKAAGLYARFWEKVRSRSAKQWPK